MKQWESRDTMAALGILIECAQAVQTELRVARMEVGEERGRMSAQAEIAMKSAVRHYVQLGLRLGTEKEDLL